MIESVFFFILMQKLTKRISARARGVFLIAGGSVARTHGATIEGTASSRAIALFGSTHQTHIGRKIQYGINFWRMGLGAEAFVHGVWIHDFARIKYAYWVKRRFECLEQSIVLRPNHLRYEFGPYNPITMLPTKGPSVFFYQLGNLGSNGSKQANMSCLFQI